MTDATAVDPVARPFHAMLSHSPLLYQPDCCNLNSVPETRREKKYIQNVNFKMDSNSTIHSLRYLRRRFRWHRPEK